MKTFEDIKGWFYYREFYDMLLGILPRGATVVEVGVFYGKGLVYLAQNQGGKNLKIYGVDPFISEPYLAVYQDSDIHSDEDFYERCIRNLFDAGVGREVTLISLPSVRAAGLFEDASLDCVFIDGNHAAEAVEEDINTWRPKVRPGGILAGDDYVPDLEGVVQVVDRMLPDRRLVGQAWYTRV